MTNFEKMKYLHRHAGKKAAEEKLPATEKTAKKAVKKKMASAADPEAGKGAGDEERGTDPAENVQG